MIPYRYGIWKPSEGRGHRFESCRVRQFFRYRLRLFERNWGEASQGASPLAYPQIGPWFGVGGRSPKTAGAQANPAGGVAAQAPRLRLRSSPLQRSEQVLT